MTREEITQKVSELVAEQLDVDRSKITPATSFVEDLGADSLDTAELVMEFEDAFDLNIPDDEQGIRTIGDAISYIEKELAKKAAGDSTDGGSKA